MSIRDKLLRRFGIEEPYALTFRGWDEFHDKVKREHPIAWFCIDTIPSKIQYLWTRFRRPFTEFLDKIRYRTTDKYHIIDTGLEPGYADHDTRITHGLFNTLVIFVERDKAMMQESWNQNSGPETAMQRLRRRFRRKTYPSNPASGLKYLQWEMSLGSQYPHQAEAAGEIWQLYHWWKFVRPNRADPMDASGWSEHCRLLKERGRHLLDTEDLTHEEELRSRMALENCRKIEENYDVEDEHYLIRLIKIRKSLWR